MSRESELNCVIGEFLDGFADQNWKLGEDGSWYLESGDGKEMFVYQDQGYEGARESYVELCLYKEDIHEIYVLQQEMDDNGVEFRLIVPPYRDEYFNHRDSWYGVVYNNSGEMEPVRRVKGLPRKIDIEKTVEKLLRQVIEKDFSTPVLVRRGE